MIPSPNDNLRGRLSRRGAAAGMLRMTALLLLIGNAGCLDSLPGKPGPEDRYHRPDTITDFPTLYQTHCSGCHGTDGEKGPAPPLNDPMFLAICSDEEIRKTIEHGRPNTPMPAMAHSQGGPLTDRQVAALVSGIREKWGAAAANVEKPLPEYLLPAPTKDQTTAGNVEAGQKKFAQYCAVCHGDDGHGGDFAGALNDAGFLGTISNQALRRIIITGRGDFDMPNFREVGQDASDGKPLTADDIADLTALLASWREAATGTNE